MGGAPRRTTLPRSSRCLRAKPSRSLGLLPVGVRNPIFTVVPPRHGRENWRHSRGAVPDVCSDHFPASSMLAFRSCSALLVCRLCRAQNYLGLLVCPGTLRRLVAQLVALAAVFSALALVDVHRAPIPEDQPPGPLGFGLGLLALRVAAHRRHWHGGGRRGRCGTVPR